MQEFGKKEKFQKIGKVKTVANTHIRSTLKYKKTAEILL